MATSVLRLSRVSVGQVGVRPGTVKMISSASLATITTVGYLNGQGNVLANAVSLSPSDVIECMYSFNSVTKTGTYAVFIPSFSSGIITLTQWANPGDVLLPVVSGDFATFNGTTGQIKDAGYLPSNAAKTKVVMANGAVIANHIATYADVAGTVGQDSATAINGGNIQAGLSGTAGSFTSFPAVAANGSFIWASVGNAGNFTSTVSPKSTLGQATVYTVPDPGAATANFVLDAGNAVSVSMLNLKYGATPVAQVDPGSCTITAVAGAANHCTITVQLKDGSGTNMVRVIPFKVYLATDNTGLTLQSAASTGYSVSSGGVKDPTGNTTITQGLAAFSSATGGCVVDLLDTGKGTGNLILMLSSGFKASAAITAGSYG